MANGVCASVSNCSHCQRAVNNCRFSLQCGSFSSPNPQFDIKASPWSNLSLHFGNGQVGQAVVCVAFVNDMGAHFVDGFFKLMERGRLAKRTHRIDTSESVHVFFPCAFACLGGSLLFSSVFFHCLQCGGDPCSRPQQSIDHTSP